ncbi:MAG: cobalamin B12-binding domain-containing protein [Elusimicrobia bacterium]|nr:cobalamin B12-binding domain-containing protein [Elusimicrobiota bacterium]
MSRARPPRAALISVSDATAEGRYLPLAVGGLQALTSRTFGRRLECRTFRCQPGTSEGFPGRVLKEVAAYGPRVVGLSCYVWNTEPVLALVAGLKKRLASVRVAVGGPEVAAGREDLFLRAGADALVFGEGESAWVELLGRSLTGEAWAGTPGTVTLRDGRPCQGPAGVFVERLGSLPSAWSEAVFQGVPEPGTSAAIENARGCPMKCSYCAWASRRQVSWFPETRVRREIRLASRMSLERVFLADSDFFLDTPRALRLGRFMRSCRVEGGPRWVLEAGLRRLTPAVLDVFDHPCFELTVGVESLSSRALRLAGRGPVRKALDAALAGLAGRRPKAEILLNLICGLPGETRQSYLKGLDAVLAVPSVRLLVFACQALPGSRLAGQPEVTEKMARPPYFVLATSTLPGRELEALQRLTLQVYLLVNHGETGARMRELAAQGRGSVTSVFSDLVSRLDPGASKALDLAWLRFRARPPRDRHFLTLDAADLLKPGESERLFRGVRPALGLPVGQGSRG